MRFVQPDRSSSPSTRTVVPTTSTRTTTTTGRTTIDTTGRGTVVVPRSEYSAPSISSAPTVAPEPGPSAVRTGVVIPEPVERSTIDPSARFVRTPVPGPYRGSNPVERPSNPAGLRAADRYRESVGSGDWDRLRDRLSDSGSLRTTTTRNLDRLIGRYERGLDRVEPSTARRASGSGRASDDYRFDYTRGPLDRLERPDAEPPVERSRRTPTVAEPTTRGDTRLAAGRRSLLDSREGIERLAPGALDSGREPLERDAPQRRLLDGLSRLAGEDRVAARRLANDGVRIADATRTALGLATRSVLGPTVADGITRSLDDVPPGYEEEPEQYWDDCYTDPWWNGGYYWGPFGYGYYNYFGFGLSFCFSWWNNPFWCANPWGWGYYAYGQPFGYSWCPPIYYSSAAYWGGYEDGYGDGYDDGGTTIIIEEQPVVVVDGGTPATVIVDDSTADYGTAAGMAPVSGSDSLPVEISGAADSYLTLGDRAFREGRYADAVHFYAKATELEPEVGVFSLVLFDALFATGDYGYAAFALRRALTLEPELVESNVDKRTFYADSSEFDRQLATLELYIEDHPADGDARLVLAANQLFSGAPARAVDTLEDPLADTLDDDDAATLILARAQATQYGTGQ